MSTLSHVIHPNIIKIFKTFEVPTHLCQILEFCSNCDMKQHVTNTGPLCNDCKFLQIVSKILDALNHLENLWIAHKDIKPSNILLDCIGRPKLADFGLSAFFDANELSDDYCGSIAFLAPDVISRKPYNPFKADIWSFGVTLYYMATGRYSWPSDNLDAIKRSIFNASFIVLHSVNDVIRKIIVKCLALHSDNRIAYSEMKSLVDDELQ